MEDYHIVDRLISLALSDTRGLSKLPAADCQKFCDRLIFVIEYTTGIPWRNGGSFRRLDWLSSLAANQGAIALWLYYNRPSVLFNLIYLVLNHYHLFNDLFLTRYTRERIELYRGLRPDLAAGGVDPYEDIRVDLYKVLFWIHVPSAKLMMLQMENDLPDKKAIVYRHSLTHLILNYDFKQASGQSDIAVADMPDTATRADKDAAELEAQIKWGNVRRRCFHIFVWAANEWILDTLNADENGWSLSCSQQVLIKLREALKYASEQKWANCGYKQSEDFPWPSSLLTCRTMASHRLPRHENQPVLPDDHTITQSKTRKRGLHRWGRSAPQRLDIDASDAHDRGVGPSPGPSATTPAESSAQGIDVQHNNSDTIRAVSELLMPKTSGDGNALLDLVEAFEEHLNVEPDTRQTITDDIRDLRSYIDATTEQRVEVLRARLKRLRGKHA